MFFDELKKMALRSLAQPVELMIGLGVLGLLFVGMQMGIHNAAAYSVNGHDFIYIYALWVVMSNSVALLNQETTNDIRMGLMEKIAIRPHVIPTMLAARCVYAFIHSLIIIIILAAVLRLFGRIPDAPLAIGLIFLSMPYGVAFGLIMMGTSLLTRQTLSLVLLLQVVIIGILIVLFRLDDAKSIWINALPMAPLADTDHPVNLLFYVLNVGIWVGVGVLFLTVALRVAKRLGTIDPHYSI